MPTKATPFTYANQKQNVGDSISQGGLTSATTAIGN